MKKNTYLVINRRVQTRSGTSTNSDNTSSNPILVVALIDLDPQKEFASYIHHPWITYTYTAEIKTCNDV